MSETEVFVDIYEDHGCNLAPSCLKCPLVVCKYDGGSAKNTDNAQKRIERDREIIRLRETGMIVDDIGAVFGISNRTVARTLKHGGASPADSRILNRVRSPEEIAGEIERPHLPSPYRRLSSARVPLIDATQIFRKHCPHCDGDVQVNLAEKTAACLQCGRDPRRSHEVAA